jgi:phosphate transport system substrate-binding protein
MKTVMSLLLFLFTISVSALPASAEKLVIRGSSAVMGNIMTKVKEPFEKSTGIQLDLLANGSLNGARDLAKGACEAAMASEGMAAVIKAVKELEGIPNLMEHVLAQDTMKVIVNKQNPVTKLSKEQLKGLNTGKIKNWKEVGGSDSDVIVVTSVKGSGTRNFFASAIMDGEPYAADAVEASTTMAETKEVATMKEAIGAVSESFVNETVKTIEGPPITRPLIFVTKGEPSPGVKKLIDFIKGEGQKYLK